MPTCCFKKKINFKILSTIFFSSTEKRKEDSPEYKIREYICSLSQDKNTTFGSTIENFIQCTLESQDTNPHHVTRNVSSLSCDTDV